MVECIKRPLQAVLLFALAAWPALSRAQAPAPPDASGPKAPEGGEPADPAPSPAQQLFDRGVTDMLEGRLDAACPAIAESYRLEPLLGVLFTLAECEAKWGKPTSSLRHYEQYIGLVAKLDPDQREKHDPRRVLAQRQIETLRTRAPSLTLILPASAPRGTRVTLDGELLSDSAIGAARYVDPGEHEVVWKVPGREEQARKETVSEGDRRVVLLESPEDKPKAAPAPDDEEGSVQRTSAYVVAGIGLAGLVVGAVTGGLALAKKKTVDDNCTDRVCNAEGKAAADAGQALADVSTVSLAVGGVAVATAVIVWLTAPRPADTTPEVSVRLLTPHSRSATRVGVEVSGRW